MTPRMPVEFVKKIAGNIYQRVGNVVQVDPDVTVSVQTKTYESVDVFIQDQNSPLVNVLLHQDLGAVTLAANTVINSRTIQLAAGHGASAGELIYLLQGSNFYQGLILNVAVNTLTMDAPMNRVFTVAASVQRGNLNLTVNGSVAAVTFHIKPPPGVSAWDITRLSIAIVDDADMDDTKFGGIAALTNGLMLRKLNGDGTYMNIGNAKTNGHIRFLCEQGTYASKAGSGQFGFNAKCVFQPSVGITVRLNPALGEELEILVQDDLTAITSVMAVAQGHEVEN